jgi:methionine-gamma-lyase
MMTLDVGSLGQANALMELMNQKPGYLAVSLDFTKPCLVLLEPQLQAKFLEEQAEMGLTDGLIRFSIGLDNDIERTYQMMKACMKELSIL